MEIKLKYYQIVEAEPALKELNNLSLNFELSYEIAKLLIKVKEEVAIFNKLKLSLLEKYGEVRVENVDGKEFNVVDDTYFKEFKELINKEITITMDRYLTYSEFNKEDKVSGKALTAIEPFCKETLKKKN